MIVNNISPMGRYTRVAKKKPTIPRFSASHNPESRKRASKALHWIMTAGLGLGLLGTYGETVTLQNKLRESQSSMVPTAQRPFTEQLVNVVNQVTPATVRVEGPMGLGSGVIIQDNRGNNFILTNGHVTEDNAFERNQQGDDVFHIKIYSGQDDSAGVIAFDAAPVLLSNGKRAYSDPYTHDLALLQIPPDVQLPANIAPFNSGTMRDLTKAPLMAGEVAVAVGNPYGLRDTVTSGIFSHVDRGFSLEPENRFIQTDTPINGGNSGGGLFDMSGRLVGINTLGYRGADGLAGSIRIDVIKAVLYSWGIDVTSSPEELDKIKEFPVSENKGRPAGSYYSSDTESSSDETQGEEGEEGS